jgi:hypothetical protein
MIGLRRIRRRDPVRHSPRNPLSGSRPFHMITPPRQAGPLASEESRGTVALTVVWMLTCLSTIVGLVVTVVLHLLMAALPAAGSSVHPLKAMAVVILLTAAATGLLCLGLTPLALRVRRTPPPRSITIAAVVVGLLPWLVIAIQAAW